MGGAYHLKTQCPDRSYVVLEAKESFGGTWLTHKYPGIRSDSDLYTFGYRFKPWVGPPIATAEEILKYMGDVIDENDLAKNIRYHHKIARANFLVPANCRNGGRAVDDAGTDASPRRNFNDSIPKSLRAFTRTSRASWILGEGRTYARRRGADRGGSGKGARAFSVGKEQLPW